MRDPGTEHFYNAESETTQFHRIFWINGLAGTGKTTIAYTLAGQCKAKNTLAASFFCSRDDAEANQPKLVFTAIADQLGEFCPPFGQQVARAHSSDPGLKYSSVSNQLFELIVKPLRSMRGSISPCVIILDALDECQDNNATSTILASLSRYIDDLAPIKFFVTSRPEPNIYGGFRLAGLQLATRRLNLHEVKLDVVEHDINLYLTTWLNCIKEHYHIECGWPTTYDVQHLTRLSSGLFIFAATAIKFIKDSNYSDPKDQLTRLLKTKVIEDSSPLHQLDCLYMQVLTGAFPRISPDLASKLKKVLGTIALLQYPLHLIDIEYLLELELGTIRITTLYLGSLLVIPDGQNRKIRLIHPSFFDFLTDPKRCLASQFQVDPEVHHGLPAQACLETIKGLIYDICAIGNPSKLDSEVDDLSKTHHNAYFTVLTICMS